MNYPLYTWKGSSEFIFIPHKFWDGKQVVTLEGDFSRPLSLFGDVELVHIFVLDL
jgi:hypothetical protein